MSSTEPTTPARLDRGPCAASFGTTAVEALDLRERPWAAGVGEEVALVRGIHADPLLGEVGLGWLEQVQGDDLRGARVPSLTVGGHPDNSVHPRTPSCDHPSLRGVIAP